MLKNHSQFCIKEISVFTSSQGLPDSDSRSRPDPDGQV